MASKIYDFTKEHSFHGEFWEVSNDNNGRFSAKIQYSPYNGLVLDYCISDTNSPKKCERLYGVLNTGEPCTLIGPFDFTQSAIHFGKIRVQTGTHNFFSIILGGFYSESEHVEYCDISLHGMQEFIHPQGFITQLRHATTPILSTQGTDWSIDVINNVTFNLIGDGLVNIVDCYEEKALEKFRNDFTNTKALFPSAIFSIRKNLKFYFRYKNFSLPDILSNINAIFKMSGLFSILINKPILPDELHLKFKDHDGKNPCLFSMSAEQRTIDLALRTIHHHFMPLNWNNIDMEKIISNWFKIGDDYDSLSVTYQSETGYRTLHQAHADIILYATQLESINSLIPEKSNEKYLRPINFYASPSLKKNIEEFFQRLNNKSLGENIATLRNELAHVGRPKVLMKKMNIDDYIEIGLYLKVIVTSHLLYNIGLSKKQIESYQNKFAPSNGNQR